MIVVDSSVWINNLRGVQSSGVETFNAVQAEGLVLLGDLILLEILQGARSNENASRLERLLRTYPIVQLFDVSLAAPCAANYRTLRSKGVTVRKTIDVIIGTYCIVHGHALLHEDRDFEPMVRHLGLKVV
jgi:predicted nucleic acid-binding protein